MLIGELTVKNPPCLFMSQHLELHLVGVELWKYETMLLGLPFLSKSFKYIAFDNPNQQIVFSKSQSFDPDIPAQWESYTMNLFNNFTQISVTIPLAGQNTEIGFDSGGGNIIIKEAVFEKLRPYLDIRSEEKGTLISIQNAKLACSKVRVRNFTIGNRTLKHALIDVLPDDTIALAERNPGFLSLREFRDTVITLDFENDLLWIKKENDSYLEEVFQLEE